MTQLEISREEGAVNLHVEKIDFANILAERYVKALWRAAVDTNRQNKVSENIAAISRLLEKKEARSDLKTAIVMKKFAFGLIEAMREALHLDDLVYNFLRLLVKNNRAYLIKDICACYNSFLSEQSGRSKFFVTISSSYEKSDKDSIAAKIKNTFSQNAECIFLPGESDFYGVRIQHKSKILDYSIESKMSRLLTVMKE